MASNNAYNLEKVRVLCVDDNKNMHFILKTILNAMKITEIRYCDNARDALSQMREWLPDVVLVDLELGSTDGLDLISQIRRGDGSPDPYVAIIVVTAHTERSRIVAARDAGAHEIIAKPVSIKTLYERLISLMDSPRPFIRAKGYVGPDRRRLARPYAGPEKRSAEEAYDAVAEQTVDAGHEYASSGQALKAAAFN